ncbi:MAG: DNA mismatch repair endonuclease MutL [Bacteroidetes bacterium]|nr:DNA mismatch repair endonuclease MutL [Bacteroidota bacterium]
MPDIIQLLPDSVANQIAAGEVIQRPASAVKELLENAVDAGSNSIQVIIKDSGKTLIQVIDNGSGMSETDARLSFERHATSKIRSADDLFCIRTMGFRGEALASIAAIAQVEMKSRKHDEEIGTLLQVEGAEVKLQQPASCSPGTSFSVRNLFYNVPARRNFLKSNTVEARHVIEEFERVALAHPDIAMSLHQNGLEVFKLPVSNLRQRIINLFGSNYNERLVPVKEETTLLNISGFVSKPEFARKSRGEQFFFVNTRFIKDAYLHHAVQNAFAELLPKDSFASYWLYIDMDPSKIDINIHPTKTEIKFEDERSIYSIVRSAVKRSLGQYSVTPSLDFEQERSFDLPHAMRFTPAQKPTVTVDTGFNPFTSGSQKISASGWDKLYEGLENKTRVVEISRAETDAPLLEPSWKDELKSESDHFIFQLHQQYIVTQVKSGLMLIDQQAAHERILYERYMSQLTNQAGHAQQSLFPQTIEFSSGDAILVKEIMDDLRSIGLDLREFGANTFVLQGTPPELEAGTEKKLVDSLLEQYKNSRSLHQMNHHEILSRSMAKNTAMKQGKSLSMKEMKNLVDELFACEKPFHGIDGQASVVMMGMDEIRKLF